MEPHLRSIAEELRLSGDLAGVMQVRRDWTLEPLVPRPRRSRRSRGYDGVAHKLGMISACSQDVPGVGPTPLRRPLRLDDLLVLRGVQQA